ncbi:MAG: glycosyl hydrolase [Luteolibacter sp.]
MSIASTRFLFASLIGCWQLQAAESLQLQNQSQSCQTLADKAVTLTGRSELHFTEGGDPMPRCTIGLNSPDAWLYFDSIAPESVIASLLDRVQVSGQSAVVDKNVRVVEFGGGTVVIPHAPSFLPLEVFASPGFSGGSVSPPLNKIQTEAGLAKIKGAVGSFRLKRGYAATFAQNANGTGASKVYIAQDGDMDIATMPKELSKVAFIRVMPWRWVSKKGWAGKAEKKVNPAWSYDWDNATVSSANIEYVPMRHNANWNNYANITNKLNSTHALGFNEPDKSDQAKMTVDQAIAAWPNLLASGMRLGAPAPSDAGSGLTWLYEFVDKAKAAGLRVDYVPVHYYKGGWSSNQLYNWLKGIHERTGLPVWITEFNNGANWTDAANPVTLEGNATTISKFMDTMNNAPFVERYAVYNWVGPTRAMVAKDGSLTQAGEIYRDKASPIGYVQEIPESPNPALANYLFEGDVKDSSGNGHLAFQMGLPNFGPGKTGQAVVLNGSTDYIRLSPKLARSSDFSFGAWVYWTGESSWQRVFDFGSGNQSMFLTPKSGDGTLRFTLSKGGKEEQLNTKELPRNQWVHLAVVLKAGTGKLFVNGKVVDTNNSMSVRPSDLTVAEAYLRQEPDCGGSIVRRAAG